MGHNLFQSTHSLRSATQILKGGGNVPWVSIHALLAECDELSAYTQRRRECFNPRTPCGVRHDMEGQSVIRQEFQSTHSLRSATVRLFRQTGQETVSIHALLAECDVSWRCGLSFPPGFQSTHSLRSATREKLFFLLQFIKFQSTHSLRSATIALAARRVVSTVSIHALLAECDFF